MKNMFKRMKSNFMYELPIIRLYAMFYMAGVFVGVIAAVLLRNDFSTQAYFLFSPENSGGFWSSFLSQLLFFLLLFLLGLTVIGLPLLPLYPLYKGFSIGLLIALAVIITGVRGLFFGTLAFFAQNLLYTTLGYFVCFSSSRLSVSLIGLLRGQGKHGAIYRDFVNHIIRSVATVPFLLLGALWEGKVVPIILQLF